MSETNSDIYKTPEASLVANGDGGDPEYAGFWLRVLASIIDNIIVMAITVPMLMLIYGSGYLLDQNFIKGGWDVFFSYIFPAVAIISFWIYKSATPGKMAIRTRIVDARTGKKPSTAQFVGRYFAYFVSMIPLLLGFLWVAFDKRKQGWHDKLANTVVIVIR